MKHIRWKCGNSSSMPHLNRKIVCTRRCFLCARRSEYFKRLSLSVHARRFLEFSWKVTEVVLWRKEYIRKYTSKVILRDQHLAAGLYSLVENRTETTVFCNPAYIPMYNTRFSLDGQLRLIPGGFSVYLFTPASKSPSFCLNGIITEIRIGTQARSYSSHYQYLRFR